MLKAVDKSKGVSAVSFHVSMFREMSLWTFRLGGFCKVKLFVSRLKNITVITVWVNIQRQDTTFSNTLDLKDRIEIGL